MEISTSESLIVARAFGQIFIKTDEKSILFSLDKYNEMKQNKVVIFRPSDETKNTIFSFRNITLVFKPSDKYVTKNKENLELKIGNMHNKIFPIPSRMEEIDSIMGRNDCETIILPYDFVIEDEFNEAD